MPKVKCEVSSCTHNMGGSLCNASDISVYQSEQTGEFSSSSAEDTQCKSFHHADGVGDMLGSLHNVNISGMVSDSFGDENMNPSVNCAVHSCEYNTEGSVCTADMIEVGGSGATNAQETDCKTYRCKQSS